MPRSPPLLAILLGACSTAEPPPQAGNEVQPQATLSPAPAEPLLLGSWHIVEIDGRAPVASLTGEPATLVFAEDGHGGNAGCNGFGGLGLQHEGRWYGGRSIATQMACGDPLNQQEDAVMDLLASGPKLQWNGSDRVTLATANRRLQLERTKTSSVARPAREQTPLLGTRWRFGSVDGTSLSLRSFREAPQVIVEGEQYRLDTPCLIGEGAWRQIRSGEAAFDPPRITATRACPAPAQAEAQALVSAIGGTKRYVTGPNGEIILGGEGHWLEGDGVRVGAAEPELVVGRWQREDASGTATNDGRRSPELVLTERSFSLWNGCNATEGLAILFERQLITRGSGMSTLANCPPEWIDRTFAGVIGSRPRVGLLANGGLLLSSPAGELRLRKAGTVDPGAGGVRTTLGHPLRFQLLGHGGGTLEITGPTRYRLSLPCGEITGSWRRSPRDPEGSYRFGPDREPEACHASPDGRILADLFRGNVEVAIGPNRDIALFVSRFGSVSAALAR